MEIDITDTSSVNNNLENGFSSNSVIDVSVKRKPCNECTAHNSCQNIATSDSIVGVCYDKDTSSLDSGCECNSSNGKLEMTEHCNSGPDVIPRRCKIANVNG
jgi:hypothetical protein